MFFDAVVNKKFLFGSSIVLSTAYRENQLTRFPYMISAPHFHRRRDAQGSVNAAEVIVGEVQAVRGPEVLPLLADGFNALFRQHPGLPKYEL